MWGYPDYVYTDGQRYNQREEQTALKKSAHFQQWTLSLPTANTKKHHLCSALYFISPYEFFWVNIHCDQQLGRQSFPHRHFICEKQLQTANYISTAPSIQKKHCQERESVLVSLHCLMFKKTSGPLKMHKKQDKKELLPFYMKNNLVNTHYFHILLSKIFKKSVILLTEHAENNNKNHSSFCLLRQKELLYPDIFKWDINKPSKLNRSISQHTMKLVIKDATKDDFKCPDGSFQCGDKSCILSVFICDDITDCVDDKDEDNSTCFEMRTFLIFARHLVGQSRKIFLNKSNLLINISPNHSSKYKKLPCELVNVNTFEHESIDNKKTSFYPFQNVCIYDRFHQHCLNLFMPSNLLFCKNHICTREFKCPHSYCIPYRLVCDGVYDCPNGEDELNCFSRKCSGKLLSSSVRVLGSQTW